MKKFRIMRGGTRFVEREAANYTIEQGGVLSLWTETARIESFAPGEWTSIGLADRWEPAEART